jgi:hypothetical protein
MNADNEEDSEETMLLEDAIIYLEDQYKDVETKGYIKPGPRTDKAAMHFATPMFSYELDTREIEDITLDNNNLALERRIINVGLKYLISKKAELYEGDFVEFYTTTGPSLYDTTSYILIGDKIEPLERNGDYFVPHSKLAYPQYSFTYWEIANRIDGWRINTKDVKMEVSEDEKLWLIKSGLLSRMYMRRMMFIYGDQMKKEI